MTEARFYHMTRTTLESALPGLLEKTLARGWRAVVMTSSAERAEHLAQHLWTYKEESFLPHGTVRDGAPGDQPIWLTSEDENPNGAQVLFLTDGAQSAHTADFALVCELFEGNGEETARTRWKAYKAAGFTCVYWKQADDGWSNASADSATASAVIPKYL